MPLVQNVNPELQEITDKLADLQNAIQDQAIELEKLRRTLYRAGVIHHPKANY